MIEAKISRFFENLHEGTSLEAFRTIYHDKVAFKDSFNEVVGIEAVHEIFAHMYENLEHPRFVIKEYVHKEDVAYVKWEFIFAFKGAKHEEHFEGVSRLLIDDENKIVSHIDYWDAAEHIYEKMPLLGTLLRYIKSKIARGEHR